MPGQGGSFLGTAAATAAGMIGGSLLLNSFRGMMGGGSQHGFGDQQSLDGSPAPWGGGNAANSDLARDAGLNDIGSAGGGGADHRGFGLFDTASNDSNADDDNDTDDSADNDSDFGGNDFGGDDFGGSDNA